MAKTSRELREEAPHLLTVFWCDRCGRIVNSNAEPDHFHFEQCGGCKTFKPADGDFGYCKSRESVYSGRKIFEHDTCSKWVEGEW
jgi:hypothetical protein